EGSEMIAQDECREVCEFIIDQSRGLNRSMDLRLLINGYRDYIQWRECQAGCHWRDLVATRLKARPIGLERAQTHTDRAHQKQYELQIEMEILTTISSRDERCPLWQQKTGNSEHTLYRRLAQIQEFGALSDLCAD